ncbi:MAG: NlpC/P60 family protein [Clostridia bacterium]
MKKRYGAGILALLILLATLCLTGTALAASKQAIVKENGTAVHAKAKASSRVLGELDKGAKVTVVAVSGSIVKIKYAGKIGFVKKSMLKLAEGNASAKASSHVTPKPSKEIIPPNPLNESPSASGAAQAKAEKAKAEKAKIEKAKIEKAKIAPGDAAESASSGKNAVMRATTQRAVAYMTPSRACKKRTSVRKGTELAVLGMSGEFYKVKRAGQVGYVLKAAFEAESEKPEPAGEDRTILSKTKVFKRASRAANVLGVLDAGETVVSLGEKGGFVRIRRAGQVGYVPSAAFVQATQAEKPDAEKPDAVKPPAIKPPAHGVSSSKANTVISSALAQLGKRYVYGTIGPATFDCSGLTYYAYKQVGVGLEHSANSVGYGAGDKVDRAHLERGDIVCFNTIGDADLSDHVGIYLGGNQFVHASSGQGRVVVSSLSGYYADNFSWGRRVI